MKKIVTCDSGLGTVNTDHSTSTTPYVPTNICIGTARYSECNDSVQESYAVENIELSGTTINLFKLLGIHEQGKLIDLAGYGEALNGSDNAFLNNMDNFISSQTGGNVVTDPSWIGYDFGTVKTSYLAETTYFSQPNNLNVQSIKIKQPIQVRSAIQVRVDRSDGDFYLDELNISFSRNSVTISVPTCIEQFSIENNTCYSVIVIEFTSSTTFNVLFDKNGSFLIGGSGIVNHRYTSKNGSFLIHDRSFAFQTGDLMTVPIEMEWFRVDVINLDVNDQEKIYPLKSSKPSRYWRIVPTIFIGYNANEPWEVNQIQLFDYASINIDNIQDFFFQENRDRDYADHSIPLKVAYTPVDAISDLTKFGFSVSESYNFTISFNNMVLALGRPIVVGDIFELPAEMQYDHNLKPVKKFLEVSDTSWSSSGYTSSWRPIIYKFQAEAVIPSQENRDLFGTADLQKYVVDDGTFFDGVQEIQNHNLTSSEINNEEARKNTPKKGTNILETSSLAYNGQSEDEYGGRLYLVEDGFPPNGLPYEEGFILPDVAGYTDGSYFRLNYDSKLNIPSRLYKFNGVKNKWEYVETDRRGNRSSHKPSQTKIFNSNPISLNSRNI